MAANGASFQTRYSRGVISQNVVARGVDGRSGCEPSSPSSSRTAQTLRLVVAFADSRIDDLEAFARELQARVDAPVIGCMAERRARPHRGPIDRRAKSRPRSVCYGDWLRVGIGVASELDEVADRCAAATADPPRGCDACGSSRRARSGLARRVHAGRRHVQPRRWFLHRLGGRGAAAQGRRRGRVASSGRRPRRARARVRVRRGVRTDAGVVVAARDAGRRFEAFTSQHLVPTHVKTVVTAVSKPDPDHRARRPPRRAAPRASSSDRSASSSTRRRPTRVHVRALCATACPYVRVVIRFIEDDAIALAAPVDARPRDACVMRIRRSRRHDARRSRRRRPPHRRDLGAARVVVPGASLGSRGLRARRASSPSVHAERPTCGFRRCYGEQ